MSRLDGRGPSSVCGVTIEHGKRVLPRIKELLHNIRDSKANCYAVKGLTSGYH